MPPGLSCPICLREGPAIAGIAVAMAVQLVVRNTFWTLELLGEDPKRRSQSAPPGLWAAEATKLGKPRRRTGRKAAARHRAKERQRVEQDVLEEFATEARQERWALFAAGVLTKSKQARLTSARAALAKSSPPSPEQAAAGRPLPTPGQDTSRLRLELSCALFCELAALCFSSEAEVISLARMGVLRFKPSGDAQIWCAEAPLHHPALQALLQVGVSLMALERDGRFQVCLRGSQPLVFQFTDKLAMPGLLDILRLQGFEPGTYRLTHLRQPLPRTGLLAEHGVGPGACIVLQTDGIVRI